MNPKFVIKQTKSLNYSRSRPKLTPLALITVTHRVLGSREEDWERTGGKMEGCENELQMFGKAARSWQTLNMNFNSGMDPNLSLSHTHTRTNRKHSMPRALVRHAATHGQKRTPGLQLKGRGGGRECTANRSKKKSNEAPQHQRVGMKRRRRAPDLHAGQRYYKISSLVVKSAKIKHLICFS